MQPECHVHFRPSNFEQNRNGGLGFCSGLIFPHDFSCAFAMHAHFYNRFTKKGPFSKCWLKREHPSNLLCPFFSNCKWPFLRNNTKKIPRCITKCTAVRYTPILRSRVGRTALFERRRLWVRYVRTSYIQLGFLPPFMRKSIKEDMKRFTFDYKCFCPSVQEENNVGRVLYYCTYFDKRTWKPWKSLPSWFLFPKQSPKRGKSNVPNARWRNFHKGVA